MIAGSIDPEYVCRICIINLAEPVVTICGHLFCWPCLYQAAVAQNGDEMLCPTCSVKFTTESLVPLYIATNSTANNIAKPSLPNRPKPNFDILKELTEPLTEKKFQILELRRQIRHRPFDKYNLLKDGSKIRWIRPFPIFVLLALPWVIYLSVNKNASVDSSWIHKLVRSIARFVKLI